jgi:hypothetical protein
MNIHPINPNPFMAPQHQSPMDQLGLQTNPFQSSPIVPNDPQQLAFQMHVQREQTLNLIRNGTRFFDPRFNMQCSDNAAAAAAAAAFFLQTAFRKPKRIRTAFTPSQLLKLEHAFDSNHYVVGQERKDLAKALNLTETQVR